MHSPWGIFDVTIAFLDPENVDFDVLHCVQKKNTHSHFLSYLHDYMTDV